jgi:hypothetical protein
MKSIDSKKGPITLINDETLVIKDPGSFLGLLYSTDDLTIVLQKENLDPSFYDLRSGLAGEILQKVSNYRRRLIILGDFENLSSKSLRDLIIECNRTGHVIFSRDMERAVELLK